MFKSCRSKKKCTKAQRYHTGDNKQKIKGTTTSDEDSKVVGPQPDATPGPEHGKTSNAAKAPDNQVGKTNGTNH